ncbi:MAG: DUF1929 domain-containing protein [Rhodospirillales bacterium]|nr:DUF1929 domain-containing protein [Rhodospirillales bacterium]
MTKRLYRTILSGLIAVFGFASHAQAQTVLEPVVREDDGPRPLDYGPGPGVPLATSYAATEALAAPAEATMPTGPTAKAKGAFGTWINWPLIGLHAALLPDGRVMSYGTDGNGNQGGFIYDLWDPAAGTHNTLPNAFTPTDLFCSAQSVFANSGNVLLTGGDRTDSSGVRNFSSNDVNVFYPASNQLLPDNNNKMMFARWYPTIVPLPNGEKLVVGGRENKGPIAATTPEVYTEGVGWRKPLFDATSDAAFGAKGGNWYYPRAYQLPNDPTKVIVLGNEGSLFYLQPAGTGSITKLAQTIRIGGYQFPTAKYAPGKLLSVRANKKVVTVDITGATPKIALTDDISQLRIWSNATVMADGKVFVNGGSEVGNQKIKEKYEAEIWDPATGHWSLAAKAEKYRLYHATALLLPDATVLTAGGGAPGPVKNVNAEIYYPPYLYDAAGNPAPRPAINIYPTWIKMSDPFFNPFWITVDAGDVISRVTLLHTGSVTHSNNMEQSFQDLTFVQSGQSLAITPPRNPNYTVPGFYMLFVINNQGVPSVAKIIKIVR